MAGSSYPTQVLHATLVCAADSLGLLAFWCVALLQNEIKRAY